MGKFLLISLKEEIYVMKIIVNNLIIVHLVQLLLLQCFVESITFEGYGFALGKIHVPVG